VEAPSVGCGRGAAGGYAILSVCWNW
jgi:hypothetical protein